MGNLQARKELNDQAKSRIREMVIGEPVTNVCAGDGNPQKHCYFVELKTRSRKNGYGITHTESWARCTDKKGKFWDIDMKVVYPGHLNTDKCKELFKPVWDAEYGN